MPSASPPLRSSLAENSPLEGFSPSSVHGDLISRSEISDAASSGRRVDSALNNSVSMTSYSAISSLRPNLRASMLDGGYYGMTLGFGETFLPAFALAIGLGEVVSGLVTSLPIFFGGIVQLIALQALNRAGSYKRWIVVGVTLQALTFVPLICAAIYGSISSWAFLFIASIYWGTGLAAGPAWNAWIGHVVPEPIRANFFAKRTRVIQLATLLGFLGGGVFLQWTNSLDAVLLGFATLFIIAGLSRFACSYYLIQHKTSKEDDAIHPTRIRLTEAWRGITRKSRTLIIYLICMQGCVQISGPYFVPYIIKQLHYSYTAFAIVIATALVARVIAMQWWGWVAQVYGADRLLLIGGLGLLPLSSLWIWSPSLPWLIFIQILSGLLWSAYELAFFLMLMEEIPQKQRASALALFNFGNSCTWCLGALAGGWWIAHFGATLDSYHGVFIISSIMRLLCVGLLWRVLAPRESHAISL